MGIRPPSKGAAVGAIQQMKEKNEEPLDDPFPKNGFNVRLKCTEARLKTIFNHSNDALFVLTFPGFQIWKVNEAATELTGMSENGILKKTFAELFPDHGLPLEQSNEGHSENECCSSTCRLFGQSQAPFVRLKALRLSFPGETSLLVIARKTRESIPPDSSKQSRRKSNNGSPAGMVTGTRSSAFEKTLSDAGKVARTDSTVLILGETGTGKELLAEYIHRNSNRADNPFIKVNCAALPENLIESELFGHERGAFTGATHQRLGRFESAHGGTLLLDEIGDLPANLQVKLLRALQEKTIERIGGKKQISIDVRVLAATHQNLPENIQSGTFRSDLFFRLNVFPLTLPPLRKRLSDLPHLVHFFIEKHRDRVGSQVDHISKENLNKLESYSWPGNIRELENIIERCLILSSGSSLEIQDDFLERPEIPHTMQSEDDSPPLKVLERNAIENAIRESNWIIEGPRGAAKRLGIPPSTLRDRMKDFGIKKPGQI